MNWLPMDTLGAQETSPKVLQFGIFLPGIDLANGYSVSVKIIHESDQYLQSVPAVIVPQTHSMDATYGDFWSGQIDLSSQPSPSNSKAWGTDGRYVYRYVVTSPNHGVVDFIIDPYSREVGVGRLSAITVGSTPYAFSPNELTWKTPLLKNAIIYELMISEFRNDLDRTIKQLPYLQDLGINCIEVMPLSNVLATIDWGYDPIGYFCVAERFGKTSDFQQFVDLCHQHNIAVVIDSVYGHTGGDFAYSQLYSALQLPSPFNGSTGDYGTTNDFSKQLTRDHFYSVNRYWLDTFHVDGFRYDDAPEYWDGPTGNGYANLVYSTYRYVKSKAGSGDHYQRFFDASGNVNLVQIAEDLSDPIGVLNNSYSTATWQDTTLSCAVSCAEGAAGAIESLGLQLGLNGYPTSVTMNGDVLPKTALQYIENHDHQRFVCNFGTVPVDSPGLAIDDLIQQGDRDGKWPMVQPYLIALLTCKGTPLLAEGQEFCENYWVPDNGYGRVMLYRPMRWNYFYDNDGQPIIRLVRKLTKIRQSGVQFSDGDYFFYNDFANFNSKGLLAFSRQTGTTFSLIVLNFSNLPQTTTFVFPIGGNYTEQIEGTQNFPGLAAGSAQTLSVPSNYGCIWTVM